MDGKKRSIMRGTLAVLGTTAAVVLALFGVNANAAAADNTSETGYEATTESGPRALSDATSFSSMEERAAGDGSDMTINLHDYSRENPDINEGHALKFGSVGGQAGENINAWTGSNGGVYQGIVASTIGGNGYPRLASDGGESLAYLFQSEPETAGVTSHDNVTGLFRLDSEGYYVYDSSQNYAYFDDSSDSFVRLGHPRYSEYGDNGSIAPSLPQFLPFNSLTNKTSTYDNSGNVLEYRRINGGRYQWGYFDDSGRWHQSDPAATGYNINGEENYSFGMDFTKTFYMPKDGQVNGEAMVFDFTGDDDVWVFIDDVLVLDLGGIHDAYNGSINFATGEVIVNATNNGEEIGPENIADIFEAAGKTWDGSDYSTHTIKFYYLERGNGGSNCRIRFNLPTIPDGTINVGKNVDYANLNNVSDLDFTFKAYIDYNGDATSIDGCELYEGSYDVYDLDTNNLIKSDVQTADDGTITLKHGQFARITDGVKDNSKYYVVETGVNSSMYKVELSGTSQELVWVNGSTEIESGIRTPLLNVNESTFVTFNNTVQAENAFNVEIKKEGSVVDGDTFYALTMIGSKKYTGEYTVYDSDDAVNGEQKTTDDGVLELHAGQHAKIVGIVGGNTVSVYEVNEDGTPFSDEMYREPTFSMEDKTTGGTVLQGAPTPLNDDNGKGIKGETNEGKALGGNPTLLATITNKLVAEPVQPELHKYVDDNEDGTYDLSLDVHGAIGSSQANPTEVDIVYILDLSYSMMWEMDGTYPGGEDNDGGDDEKWADEYSFVRYNAAVNAINTLNSELAANEGLDVRAALVTFAPETLNKTGFVSASSFSSMLPAAQWSTFASGTNYGAALNSAKSVLEGAREDAQKVVIFISDGEPNRDGFTENDKGDPDTSTQFAVDQVRGLACDSFYTVGVGGDNYEQYLKRVVNAADSAKSKQYFASANSDALSDYFESIASAITAVDCTNVVITDKLSDYAELTDDATFNVTITKDDHGGESVPVNGGPVSIEDAKKGAELTFQSADGTDQALTLTYDENTKTFTLAFPQNYALEAGWTYTITTQIQPTEEARNYYQENGQSPDTGDPETDVPGTSQEEWISSGKPGFHSNLEATLSYTSAMQDKVDEYPNPVIQANQLTIKDVLKVTKTLNGHPLDEGMFDFTVEPKAWDNGNEGDEKVEVTAQQAADKAGLTAGTTFAYQNVDAAQPGEAGLVRMGNEITFTTDDIGKTYVYEYAELGGLNEAYLESQQGLDDVTNDDILFDSARYKVELAVSDEDGKLQVTMSKFMWDAEDRAWKQAGDAVTITSANCDRSDENPLMTVDFKNTYVQGTNISCPVGIEKTLEGDSLTEGMFKFTVTAKTTDTVNETEAAFKAGFYTQEGDTIKPVIPWEVINTGDKFSVIGAMHFTAGDADNVYEYVIAEDNSYIGPGYERDDFLYDDTQYLVQFKPVIATSAEGAKSLEVELWVAERDGAQGNFSKLEKVGVYSHGKFNRVDSQAEGRALQDDPQYLLEFTNKVSKADLRITKKLEQGVTPGVPISAQFKIQIELRDQDGELVNGTFDAAVGSETRKVEFKDGVATVTIKADETIVIKGVPVGAACKVSEPEDQIPGGFELAWVDGSPVADGKADTRAANKDEWNGEIDPDGSDVTVTNRFVGYGVQIFKGELAESEDGGFVASHDKPLEGAEFELYALNPETGEELVMGRLTTDSDGSAVFQDVYSVEQGKLQLPAGTYFIRETKVPAGYQLLEKEIKLEIKADGSADFTIINDKGEPGASKKGVKPNESGNFTYDVANKPNPGLPSSGSNGTLLMMSTGFAAIVLAGTYLSKRFGHLWN